MKMFITKNKKGLIGAIGDDLPSLIPIFLGLVVFFAVFLNTYNVYKDTSNLYDLQQEAIKIAMTLKAEPLIPDYNFFNETCGKVNTTTNWTAFLIDLPLDTNKQISLSPDTFADNIIKDTEENLFICGDDNIESVQKLLQNNSSKLIYLYPITVQRKIENVEHALPAKLYVIVWR